MSLLREALRCAWAYAILGVGFGLLVAELFAWALAAVPLYLVLPAPLGRRVGRAAAMTRLR